MIEIAPGSGYALASEWEGDSVPVEDAVETTEPPALVEESGSPADTAEAEITPTTEPDATPEVTAAEDVAETPEVTPTAEPTVTPEVTTAPKDVTETPEVTPTAEPTVTPEVTAVPEVTDTPEPEESPALTEVPAPLMVWLSSDVRSAFADEDAIVVSLRIEGGTPEYTIAYQITLDGTAVETSVPLVIMESTDSYAYMARSLGVHTITVTVTDACGQTGAASVSVPVAVRDTTSAAEQRRRAEAVRLTGDWRRDMLAVAASQLGYQESETDFTMLEDGSIQGYTVYGDWYGAPYEPWSALFIAYCAHYAKVPEAYVPRTASLQQLLNAANGKGAYFTRASGYEPEAGDIVFLNDGSGVDRAGLVEGVSAGNIRIIEGDHSGSVGRDGYSRNDSRITGYASMRALMTQAGVLAEEDEPERAVEEAQAMIDALPGKGDLAAAYEQLRAAYEVYKSLTAEQREQLVGADVLKDILDVENLISELPDAAALPEMDIDSQRAAYEQTQAAYDAYMALTEEQRELVAGAEVFEALFAFFNSQLMLLDGYSGGNGTAEDPYQISSREDMWALAENTDDWNKHFVLTSDIDLDASEGNQWSPIGSNSKGAVAFSGSFDGKNHTISGLYIKNKEDYQGLFGYVTDGTISNLKVNGYINACGNEGGIVGSLNPIKTDGGRIQNCSYSGYIVASYIDGSDTSNGGIVGYNHGGKVIDCHNSATIECQTQFVGGIVGQNSGTTATVENCSNTGNVTIYGTNASYAGGIVGVNNTSAKIINCFNSGKVDGAGSAGVIGGIVGSSTGGSISQSHNDGAVTGGKYVGGIAGQLNDSTISQCYNIGAVTGSDQIGGVVGTNTSKANLEECYNTAQVSGTGIVGGVAGGNDEKATVTNCYNEGDVSGNNAGGIVGQNYAGTNAKNTTVGTVANCYSRGTITGKNIGSIVGSNGNAAKTGTVTNCYYLTGNVGGINGSEASGQAEVKTAEEFASGEVAWLLQHRQSSLAWGQELVKADKDSYPLLHNTGVGAGRPQVLKVIFRTSTVENCQMNYTNDGGGVAQPSPNPETDGSHVFYEWRIGDENGERYDGTVHGGEAVTDDEVIIVAVQRETFGGEDEENNVIRVIYGEGVRQNLDAWVGYATGMTSTADKFEYKLAVNGIGAVMEDNVLTVPATTAVNEQGYELTVTAHEKQPQVSPISIGGYGTVDVTLRIRVIISKATPKIAVTAEAIDYGHTLNDSTLTGTGTHPTKDKDVPGKFMWDNPGTIPTVIDAAKVGYPVTFMPDDTENYNIVSTMVTLKVNKVDPKYEPPTARAGVYTSIAQALIDEGSTDDGTMKYRLDGDENDYSSTIPERANAGTYTVWYKVFGDDNHNDTEEKSVTVTIAPYPLIIENQSFTYNGKRDLTVTVPGVGDETVTVTLTADSKDAGSYAYADEAGEGSYTAVIAAPNASNYKVDSSSGKLTIQRLPVQLLWSEELSFTYDNSVKTVTATVINRIDDDEFTLSYAEDVVEGVIHTNKATNVGDYIAQVTGLGNPNYTLDNVQNVSQAWHITKDTKTIRLEQAGPIFYGAKLVLTAQISPSASGIDGTDTVEFYINGFSIGESSVIVANDVGTATMVIDNATSALHFAADNNTASVKYSGNANEKEAQSDAITILVNPKPITAEITGDNTIKTYDGDNIAVDLELKLNNLEKCDEKDVTATAKSYTYNSKDVKDAKTITANEIELSGIQSGNYVLDTKLPVETSGEIRPKTVKLEWRGVNGLVYNGNSANVTATATELVSGDVVRVTVSDGTGKNAATYIARAVALTGADGEPNDNYTLPKDESAEQEYIIDPAPLLIAPMTVTYNGTREFSAEEDGVVLASGATEKVAVTLTASEANAGEYTYDSGSKTYTASTTDTNYKITNGATLTIEKAVPNVSWPVFNGTVYVNDDPPTAAYFTSGSATGVDDEELSGAFALDGAMRWTKSGAEEVTFTFTPDDTTNYISVTNEHVAVRVDKRQVASVDDQTPIFDKVYGTEMERLGLPDSVTITTADGKRFYKVRVTWTGYDSKSLEEQNLIGTLDLSDIKDEVENPNDVQASIEVTLQPLMPGAVEYSDKTVIYSGVAVTHEIAGGIEGVTGVTYEYEGLGDTAYGPSSVGPTDAGMYTVTATFAMEAGYKRLEDVAVRLIISPAALTIPEQSFTYQGSDTFNIMLNGVNNETVAATLTAYLKDVGSYAYATETGEGLYTAELSSANYTVGEGGTLTITPKAAVLTWKEPLSFAYDGQMHEVTAEVSNAVRGDAFSLTYEDNTGVDKGSYTARVTELGNQNYTLTDAQNVTQVWHITQEAAKVTLTVAELITYGDQLTLTATIAKAEANGIALMALDPDTVQFYANGVLLDSVGVEYEGTSKDSGTASLTINATSANHLRTGVNELKAVYSGNSNVLGGEATVRVSVAAKTIRGRMVGDTVKTYDGLDSATGLNIELDGVEECDQGQVTATAGQYTYDSADAGNNKTVTARDVVLVGAQSGNYRLETASVTAAGVINPKVVGLEWSGYTDLVYTGKPVNVTATATGLISGDECGVVVENGRRSEVGTYTATATGLTNPNYALPATGTTQEYTITGTDTDDPSNTDGPDSTDNPNNQDDPSSTKKPGNSSDGTDNAGGTQGSKTPPKTGDNSMLAMWVLLMVLSLCGMAAVLAWNTYTNRKSKR